MFKKLLQQVEKCFFSSYIVVEAYPVLDIVEARYGLMFVLVVPYKFLNEVFFCTELAVSFLVGGLPFDFWYPNV
jgi:hypothetical protein